MRILFLNIPAAGHVNPTLPIVSALADRGHDVYYANAADFRETVEEAGAQFLPYAPDSTADIRGDPGNFARLGAKLHRYALRIVRRHLEEYRRLAPDLVVFDSLAVWGPVIADILGTERVGSFSVFVYDRSRSPMRPAFALRLAGMIIASLPQVALALAARRRLHRRSSAVPALMDTFTCTGRENIVCTIRELQPAGETFGPSFHFVGPLLERREPSGSLGGTFGELLGKLRDKGAKENVKKDVKEEPPLVYVALGTLYSRTGHAPRRLNGFYQRCIDALADIARPVVISAGDWAASLRLPAEAEHIIIRESVPQLAVLSHAAVFITHGGMNSVHEALYYGIPMLLVPQQAEQEAVAAQVVSRGAGISLGRGPYTAAALRRAVKELLRDHSYAQAAATLSRSMRSSGGTAAAVEVLLRAAARH